MITNSHQTSSKSHHLTKYFHWVGQFGFQNFRVDEIHEWHTATFHSPTPVLLSNLRVFLDYIVCRDDWIWNPWKWNGFSSGQEVRSRILYNHSPYYYINRTLSLTDITKVSLRSSSSTLSTLTTLELHSPFTFTGISFVEVALEEWLGRALDSRTLSAPRSIAMEQMASATVVERR